MVSVYIFSQGNIQGQTKLILFSSQHLKITLILSSENILIDTQGILKSTLTETRCIFKTAERML